ncbi:MAG: hypothetical protein ACRYFS_17610 [Janthinobacterium lividum]
MPSLKNSALSPADFSHFFCRSLAITAVFAGSFAGTAAVAQTPAVVPAAKKIVTQQITFSSSHQDYWGGVFANTHRLELFSGYPNDTITFEPPVSTDFHVSTSDQPITFKGGLSNSELGLTLNAYATAGDVTVNYPGSLALTLDPQLTPNTLFNFQTSFSRDQANSNLDITPPGFDATLGAIVKGDFSLAGTVHTPGKLPNIDFTIFNSSVNTAFNIFDVQNDLIAPLEADGGLNTQHDLSDYINDFPAGIIKFEVDDPRVVNFDNNSTASSSQLSYAGFQQLLDLNGDVSNLVGYLSYAAFTDGKSLPQGLFNADYGFNIGSSDFGGGFDLSYQIADLYGDMPLGFEQNFTFDAQPKTTITLLGPQGKQIGSSSSVSVGAAGSIQIPDTYADGTPILPYGVTSVPITVQSTLDFSQNTLHNDTDLQWKPGLYFEPYSFSASVNLDLGSLGFNKSVSYGYSPGPITVASQTFSYTALSHDTTIPASNYVVSPSSVTSTINYVGTSIDSPHPTLTSLSQNSALTGSGNLTLTLTGTGFINQSRCLVSVSSINGITQQNMGIHYISPTSIQVSLPQSEFKVPATLALSVSNLGLPAPATYVSNALPFLVAIPGCYLNAYGTFQSIRLTADSKMGLILANNSTIDAVKVKLFSVTLNGVNSTTPPQSPGAIRSGASSPNTVYSFPASAITGAAREPLKVTGTINGTAFALTVPVAVPAPQLNAIANLSRNIAGTTPSQLNLTLENVSVADAANVQISKVTLNGHGPLSSSAYHSQALPLSLGIITSEQKSSGGLYYFAPNIIPLFAGSAQVIVTGTQNGKPFTSTVTAPVR